MPWQVPHYVALLDRLGAQHPELPPPCLLMVDGCGILHPRGCGAASHLGVLRGLPSIGVAKELLQHDGLEKAGVRKRCDEQLLAYGDSLELRCAALTAPIGRAEASRCIAVGLPAAHRLLPCCPNRSFGLGF